MLVVFRIAWDSKKQVFSLNVRTFIIPLLTKGPEKISILLVYYAKPYAPWQKGAVENANMLIRQYVPKGFNINTMSIQYLAYIQNKINSRPREKLNFKSPIFVFNKKIQ